MSTLAADSPSSARSPHFIVSDLPGGEQGLDAEAVAVRLESTRAALARTLGLPDSVCAQIRVEAAPSPEAGGDARRLTFGALPISTWSLGLLERDLVSLLLSEAYGKPRRSSALIVDGLLGVVGEHGRRGGALDARVAASVVRGEDVRLSELLSRDAPLPSHSAWADAAASFVGHVLRTRGTTALADLWLSAGGVARSTVDDANPLVTMERDWRAMLDRAHARELGVAGLARNGWRYSRPHWRSAMLAGVTLTPSVAFIMLQPLALAALVDLAILPRDSTMAAELIAGLVALLVVYVAGDLAHQYTVARLATLIGSDLRRALFEHFQRLSLAYFGRSQQGDLLSRFTSSIEAVERAVGTEIPFALNYLLTIGVGAAILLAIEWRLAVLCLALLPTVLIGPRVLAARAEEANYERQAAGAQLASTVQENLAGYAVVKAFGLQDLAQGRFDRELRAFRQRAVRVGFLSSVVGASMTVSAYSLLVIAMGTGTFMAMSGSMTVGSLVAFTEILWWMSSSVQLLGGVVPPIQQAAAGLQRIREVLNEHPHVADAHDAVPLPTLASRISMEDVSFSYTGDETSLRDVSLRIDRGESVAFIGPSGCGKSTVLSLLLRFYDPQHGAVRYDGFDARSVTQASLRSQIATVLQDSFLFNATIRENIRMGRPSASDAEVEVAARAAEIHDSILALPYGYETVVGERGGRLSGGQRQRIAIARAVLRNPPILILDEATSALDVATEAAVNATLRKLGHGRTVVNVTHRLATVAGCDRIFVLDQGRIVEHGRHAELLAREGEYYRMWQKQSRFVVSEDGSQAGVDPDWLPSIPLFAGVPEPLLADIAGRLVTEGTAAGRALIVEGDPGDKFYILVRGSVEVVKHLDGRDQQLAVLQDGDFFGETALLHDVPRTATVRTLTSCTFLTLQRGQFLDLVHQAPELARVIDEVERQRLAEQAEAGAH
ncbi:MAG: ABC transporter transmembrane domain-containing protein [Chloroflexota bacterium]